MDKLAIKNLFHVSCLLFLLCSLAFLPRPVHGQIPVTGQVLDADGTPRKGARVELFERLDDLRQARAELGGRWFEEAKATTTTNGAGRFRLEAPGAGMWLLRVRATGAMPALAALDALVEPRHLPVLELVPARPLKLRILGPEGRPLPGAGLRSNARPWEAGSWQAFTPWRPLSFLGRVDAEGWVEVPRPRDLLRTPEPKLFAWAPGFLETEVSTSAPGGTVRLQRARGTVVEVTDHRGERAPGVTVRAGAAAWPVGLTGPQGRITLYRLPGESLELVLEAGDGRRLETDLPQEDRAGKPFPVVLPPIRSHRGRVISALDRHPIPGAVVWLLGREGIWTRTDVPGVYELQWGNAGGVGKARLGARAAGFLPERDRRAATDGEGPTLALDPSSSLEGLVLSARGELLEGALVSAGARGDFGYRRRGFAPGALTDARGRFVLHQLRPGQSYRLRATLEGWAPAELEAATAKAGKAASPVRIVLSTGSGAFGRVLGPADEPVVGARVLLIPVAEAGTHPHFSRARAFSEESLKAETGGDGRYHLPALVPGAYDLEVRAAGFAPARVRGLEISSEGVADLGEVVLEPGVKIEGRVVNEEGQPLAEVSFHASGGGVRWPVPRSGDSRQETQGDGRFVLEDLTDGQRYNLRFRKKGFLSHSVPAVTAPTEEPLEVVLEAGSRVEGRVVDDRFEGVPGARLHLSEKGPEVAVQGRIYRRGEGRWGATTDDSGRFVIEGVAAGTYSLLASAPSFVRGGIDRVEVAKGEALDGLRITLETGATLEGQVLDEQGRPLVKGAVYLQPPEGPEIQSWRSEVSDRTDGDGRYRLEGLKTGLQTVRASRSGYRPVEKELEIQPGTNRLDLTLKPGLHVSGRVVDPEGNPLANAQVELAQGLRGSAWSSTGVTSDAEGNFRFESVESGHYTLTGRHDGFAPSKREEPIEVTDFSVEGLVLRLETGVSIIGNVLGLDFDELAQVMVVASRQEEARYEPLYGVVDYKGLYRIDNAGTGRWTLIARLGDGRRTMATVEIPHGAREVQADLEFEGDLTLTGQVLLRDEPLSGARIHIADPVAMASGGGFSDHQGRFEIRGLEAGTYQLAVHHLERAVRHMEEVELTTDRDVMLRIASGFLQGRAVSAEDQSPVEGALVELRRISEPPFQSNFEPTLGVSTDGVGEFAFEELSTGAWQLTVTRSGYATVSRFVEILDGGGTPPVEISLEPTEGLRLEAFLSSGAPLTLVFVTLVEDGAPLPSARSYSAGSDGIFHLASVPSGNRELLISAPGQATVRVSAAVPGPPVRVRLSPGGTLEVTLPEGEGVEASPLLAIADAAGRSYADLNWGSVRDRWPLRGGRAVIEPLPAGRWTLTALGPDGRVWSGTAIVTVGARASVELAETSPR